jgi:hypothetical protein
MKPNHRLRRNVFYGPVRPNVSGEMAWNLPPFFGHWRISPISAYCFSYSPLFTRLSTVKPAFLASVTDSGLSFIGELNEERIFRTGFLQAGQFVKGLADSGRRRVNFPPHTLQSPSHSSYS